MSCLLQIEDFCTCRQYIFNLVLCCVIKGGGMSKRLLPKLFVLSQVTICT